MENIAGKLKKLNSMSNVIRLDFWDFVAVEAESLCCQSWKEVCICDSYSE